MSIPLETPATTRKEPAPTGPDSKILLIKILVFNEEKNINIINVDIKIVF